MTLKWALRVSGSFPDRQGRRKWCSEQLEEHAQCHNRKNARPTFSGAAGYWSEQTGAYTVIEWTGKAGFTLVFCFRGSRLWNKRCGVCFLLYPFTSPELSIHTQAVRGAGLNQQLANIVYEDPGRKRSQLCAPCKLHLCCYYYTRYSWWKRVTDFCKQMDKAPFYLRAALGQPWVS